MILPKGIHKFPMLRVFSTNVVFASLCVKCRHCSHTTPAVPPDPTWPGGPVVTTPLPLAAAATSAPPCEFFFGGRRRTPPEKDWHCVCGQLNFGGKWCHSCGEGKPEGTGEEANRADNAAEVDTPTQSVGGNPHDGGLRLPRQEDDYLHRKDFETPAPRRGGGFKQHSNNNNSNKGGGHAQLQSKGSMNASVPRTRGGGGGGAFPAAAPIKQAPPNTPTPQKRNPAAPTSQPHPPPVHTPISGAPGTRPGPSTGGASNSPPPQSPTATVKKLTLKIVKLGGPKP